MKSTARAADPARSVNERTAKPPAVTPKTSLAEQILGNAQAGRSVIQDFVPLAESLEWELGQQYLRERGNKAGKASDAAQGPNLCPKLCPSAGRALKMGKKARRQAISEGCSLAVRRAKSPVQFRSNVRNQEGE